MTGYDRMGGQRFRGGTARWGGLAKAAARAPLCQSVIVVGGVIWAGLAVGAGSYTGYLIALVLVYGVAAYGLDVIVGFVGTISLGQAAVVGVGAYVAGNLIAMHHWPLIPALLAAGGAGAVVGVIMGGPAARIGPIGAAIVTLGYTLVFSDLVVGLPGSLTGVGGGIVGIAGPWLIPGRTTVGGTGVYVLICVVAALTYVGHWYLRQSRFGRAAIALKDDPVGAEMLGIPAQRVRLGGFVIGSAVGGVAGGLYAVLSTVVSPGSFGLQLSLVFLAMVILGGTGTRVGPVFGVAIVGLVPALLSSHPALDVYLYGGILILSVRVLPRGIMATTAAPLGKRAVRRVRAAGEFRPHSTDSIRDADLALEVMGLSRAFGRVHALDSTSLECRQGEIVGVVGPNGSGKTTLLNLICGFYRWDSGTVKVAGTRIEPDVRQAAEHGIARTFQTPRVFPRLSVQEHLAVAVEQSRGTTSLGSEPLALLLEQSGLDSRMAAQAGSLSQGHLRFLEVAMALLRLPSLLLLDEPCAGLAASEMKLLGDILARTRAAGTAVVLVEHHLEWTRTVADRIVVMVNGSVLWSGDPVSLAENEAVRAAYLGRATRG